MFLKGQRTGWLSAEYSMLPCATQQRTIRESSSMQKNARSVEISRLIGRCLRPCVNLNRLGERSIHIDCDVLQADGGTRVASITAASLALNLAVERWIQAGFIEENIVTELVAAVSVGVVGGELVSDLNYIEDKDADADFNIVVSRSGKLIEIQGTSEKSPISWDQFEQIKILAQKSIEEIFNVCSGVVPPCKVLDKSSIQQVRGFQNNGGKYYEKNRNTQDRQTNNQSNNQANNPTNNSANNSAPGIFSLSNRIKKS
jgi:ribonuclease PH